MRTRVCDKCGGLAEAPGSVTLRVIDGQFPSTRPRADLCPRCGAELERWLSPPMPRAAASAGDDDDQADELEAD
jgi:hypothetical protein